MILLNMWNLKNQMTEQNMSKIIDTGNRMVVAEGKRVGE